MASLVWMLDPCSWSPKGICILGMWMSVTVTDGHWLFFILPASKNEIGDALHVSETRVMEQR